MLRNRPVNSSRVLDDSPTKTGTSKESLPSEHRNHLEHTLHEESQLGIPTHHPKAWIILSKCCTKVKDICWRGAPVRELASRDSWASFLIRPRGWANTFKGKITGGSERPSECFPAHFDLDSRAKLLKMNICKTTTDTQSRRN
jgi:hypothetical protein